MILNQIKFLFRAFVSEKDSDPTEWHIWYEGLLEQDDLAADEAVRNDIDIFDLRDYIDDLDPNKCYQVYGSGTLVYTYCDATQEYDCELVIGGNCLKTEWIPGIDYELREDMENEDD